MNEKRVFSNTDVQTLLAELDVLLVRSDYTDRNPAIATDLSRLGRANLPTNVVYPADPSRPAIILPEVISPQDALEALRQAQ